ncbi:uncharacterized protein PFL1_00874 [Pseudozyma flocculosa PF-1]|uniref:Secreted protein n=1 Tax=Pseudozyma flocculosa TaxID=84751 RepID=A0A5C3F624_9BASI|nr:uncharacterized protein PFL1_00874 [Pseudozyma flocculosa PF-1]EPQ31541.1 hypothetical protein PFL1_00874 [Pseudozyma flocculosa PF-1]SPO38671.1 uncharacterized protein PSFLO_04150 [Pseudozyma flocculosa]
MKFFTPLVFSALFACSAVPGPVEAQQGKTVRSRHYSTYGTFSIQLFGQYKSFRFDDDDNDRNNAWSLAVRQGNGWHNILQGFGTGSTAYATDKPQLVAAWNDLNSNNLNPSKYKIILQINTAGQDARFVDLPLDRALTPA